MGVKISELNEALSVQNSDVLPIVQNGETKKIPVEVLGSQKVNKSGDTLTGGLMFENKDGYDAIRKTRTINNTDYQITVGLGGNISARMELVGKNDTVLGSAEVRSDGIYNGKTNKKLAEEVGNVSLTTTLQTGRATAYRVGNIVIVNIYGQKDLPSAWTDYTIVTLSGVTAKDLYQAPIVDQSTGLCADIFISQNSNVIKINKRAVSSINQGYFRGQLIFVAN